MMDDEDAIELLLRRLRECLRPPQSEFEVTEDGIWHPTPLDVIGGVLRELERLGGDDLRVMDAGAGDGRWLVALGLWARRKKLAIDVRGAETDPDLFVAASEALRRAGLQDSVELRNSDYLDDREALVDNDVVLHYPDGNEQELAHKLVGSNTELWIVTSQLNATVDLLEFQSRRRIVRHGNVDWHHFVYTDPREA